MATEKSTDPTSGPDKTANAAETAQPGNPEKSSAAKPADSTAPANEAPADRSADTSEKSPRRPPRRRSGRSGRSSETDRANAADRTADRTVDRSKSDPTSDRTSDQTTNRPKVDRTADQTADRSKVDRTADRTNTGRRSEAPARDDNSKRQTANSSGRSNSSNSSNRRENSNRSASTGSASTPRLGGYSIRPSEPAKATKPASRWTLRDYILQLSVVIIGIVVTFAGSAQIERWRQVRQVKDTMQLVYEELKADREQLESICAWLSYDQQGMELVSEQNMDYKRVPIDSLRKYQYILGQMRAFTPRTDALEVLKVSETATSVDDKQLLMEVMACYSWMVNFSGTVQTYSDQKLKSINHLFANGMNGTIGGADPVESWRTMMTDPMCAAFIGTMRNFFGTDLIRGEAVAKVDAVLASLNDKYHFE